MEFTSIFQIARAQGPVFWVATVAIALGATLLVVALIQLLRRWIATRVVGAGLSQASPAPSAAAVDADDVYVPSRPAAPPMEASAGPVAEDVGDYSLALLLRRLHSAGDRLEEIAGDARGENPLANDSGLKEDLQEVEYVFRASGP